MLCKIRRGTYRKVFVDTRAPFFRHRGELTSSEQQKCDYWKESESRRYYTRDQLEAGRKAYETCVEESACVTRLRDCFPLPHDCLPRFRNLREVAADRIKRSGISRVDATAYWNYLKRRILINPFSRALHGDAVGVASGAAPTLLLLVALGNRSRVEGVEHVERLTIEMPANSYDYYLDLIQHPSLVSEHSDNDEVQEAHFQVFLDVFKHLKHLVMLCPGTRKMDIYKLDEYRECEDEPLLLLDSATNLESLELEIGEGDRMPLKSYDLEEIRDVDDALLSLLSRPWTTFPCLRELKIGASLHPEPFTNFLSQHKSTLRNLVMTDCIGYDWGKILDFVDQDLKLDHFRARFLWMRRLKTGVGSHCIEFSDGSYREDDEDDRDWEDSWHDDKLERFRGKFLLFDVPLNEKMNNSYEEFNNRFR
jgi:hypothetical protein